jgi:hypothetical protein
VSIVLDASAILAVIMGELGEEKLTPRLLAEAVISTVNLAEVQGKLQSLGWTDEAWEDATGLLGEAIHFDEHQARTAGDLFTQTRVARRLLVSRPGYGTGRSGLHCSEGVEEDQSRCPHPRNPLNGVGVRPATRYWRLGGTHSSLQRSCLGYHLLCWRHCSCRSYPPAPRKIRSA